MESHHAKTEGRRGTTRAAVLRPDPARIAAVRQRLYDAGQTVTDWARENGETMEQVSKVLSGTRACARGEAHRIAVKLGLKDGAPAPVARA